MNKKYIMGFVFISAVLFTLINTFVQSKSQYNKNYNFVISNIRVTPTHTLVFFKETEEIYLWNYIISDKEGVEVGDLLYKKNVLSICISIEKTNRENI